MHNVSRNSLLVVRLKSQCRVPFQSGAQRSAARGSAMFKGNNNCVQRLLGIPDARPARVVDEPWRRRVAPRTDRQRRSPSPRTPRARSPSVDSESEVMPDMRADVIQQARAIGRQWSSGGTGRTPWPPFELTAADRAAMDVRSRRGGQRFALGGAEVEGVACVATFHTIHAGAAEAGAAEVVVSRVGEDARLPAAAAAASATDGDGGGPGGQRHSEETGVASSRVASEIPTARPEVSAASAEVASSPTSDSDELVLDIAPVWSRGARGRGRGRPARGRGGDDRQPRARSRR